MSPVPPGRGSHRHRRHHGGGDSSQRLSHIMAFGLVQHELLRLHFYMGDMEGILSRRASTHVRFVHYAERDDLYAENVAA